MGNDELDTAPDGAGDTTGRVGADRCPSEELVVGFFERRLSPAQRDAIERHTDRCAACRQLLVELAGARDTVARSQQATADGRPRRQAARPAAAPPTPRGTVDQMDSDGATLPAGGGFADLDLATLPVRDPGRYVRLGELARGGMGRIVSVHDRELGRDLAIKEMIGSDPGSMRRFEREVRITARLQHPVIIAVHEAGCWPTGEPFFTMKRVEGLSLHDVIAERPTLAARLELLPNIIAVADAMAFAHRQGVIHRDLKPANVLVGDFGETVLIDWGLAKDLRRPDDSAPAASPAPSGDDDGLTLVGEAMGTPAYMAPEQARGEAVDTRADVYALGALLYHLIAGAMPYLDERPPNGRALLAVVVERGPTPLPELISDAPRELVAIVDKALSRQPEDRYRDAGELAGDLHRFQQGQMVSAHDYSGLALVRRWAARHRTLVASVSAVVVFGLVAGGFAFTREQRLRHEAQHQRDRATLAQGQAEAERHRVEVQSRYLLEQQGRAELEASRPRRAAVLLAEVLRAEPDNLVVRSLVSEALRNLTVLRPGADLAVPDRTTIAVAVSPDGRLIATAGEDRVIRLWDAHTARPVATLAGHTGAVVELAFSHDSTLLASASFDGTARLWNLADRTARHVLAHGLRLTALAFTPDDTTLVTGGGDRSARLWDTTTGAPGRVIGGLPDSVQAMTIGPGPELMLTVGRMLESYDLRTGKRTRSRYLNAIGLGVALDFDRKAFYAGDDQGNATVWHIDPDGFTRSLLLDGHAGAASTVAVSPDGMLLATGDRDGIIRLWDARAGVQVAAADVGTGAVRQVAFLPDGRGLVSVGAGGHAALWTIAAERLPRRLDGDSYVYAAEYTDDGARLLLARADGTVEIRDPRSLALVVSFAAGAPVFDAHWSPDATRIVTAGWKGARALAGTEPRLWDATRGTLIAVLEGHTDQVYRVGFSPDGGLIATVSWDGSVRLWDGVTGAARGVLDQVDERYFAVAFHPDGTRLAAAQGRTLRVFDLASRAMVREIEAHDSDIATLAYSRDGSRLVTGGRDDYVARVWDGRTLAPIAVLRGHHGRIMSVHFSPDGRRIASAGFDNAVRLWDAITGERLRTIESRWHLSAIDHAGEHILTNAPHHGYVLEWDITLDRRSPDQIADQVAGLSPWRLVDGRLVMPGPAAADR